MQIEQKNYIFDLPNEVLDKLFYDCLDEKSRLECGFLDKRIYEYIFDSLIFKIKIPIEHDLSSFSQIIKLYKEYCKFFIQHLPESFPDRSKYVTVIATKIYVDSILSMPYDIKKGACSILEEAWHCFSETLPFINFVAISEAQQALEIKAMENGGPVVIQPIKSKRGIRSKVKMIFNNTVSIKTNQEIQIFLASGARTLSRGRNHAHLISGLLETDWCTLETIKMLVQCKFEVSPTTVLNAVKSKPHNEILPILIKSATDKISLQLFCEKLPPDSRYLIEDDAYLEKIPNVSHDIIALAMKNLHSETFISKLVNKCKKIDDDSILITALKDYSEILILKILDKCDKLTYQDLILLRAVTRKCSENVLEEIAHKSSKIRFQTIELAEKQGIYSESLIKKMCEKR